MLALGTDDGKVLAVDVSTGERKWPTSHPIPGYFCHLNLFILNENFLHIHLMKCQNIIAPLNKVKTIHSNECFLASSNLHAWCI